MGVGGGRGGVGDAGGRDDAGRPPAASAISKIVFTSWPCAAAQSLDRHRLVDADHVVAGLDAGGHGGRGRRGIGDLGVVACRS